MGFTIFILTNHEVNTTFLEMYVYNLMTSFLLSADCVLNKASKNAIFGFLNKALCL